MKEQYTRCMECQHCKIQGKSVFCRHQNQRYIHEYFRNKRMTKMPAFLGFTYKGFPIKKSPAWCPFKMKEGEKNDG